MFVETPRFLSNFAIFYLRAIAQRNFFSAKILRTLLISTVPLRCLWFLGSKMNSLEIHQIHEKENFRASPTSSLNCPITLVESAHWPISNCIFGRTYSQFPKFKSSVTVSQTQGFLASLRDLGEANRCWRRCAGELLNLYWFR